MIFLPSIQKLMLYTSFWIQKLIQKLVFSRGPVDGFHMSALWNPWGALTIAIQNLPERDKVEYYGHNQHNNKG